MKASRFFRSRLVLALAVACVGLEVSLSLVVDDDGRFFGRPLPPFGAITHPAQRDWLEWQRGELSAPPEARGAGVFDAELGWTNRPAYASADGRSRFNSLAARGGREYAHSAPPGAVRVACFGDSFTYCDHVRDGESWEAQLEALDPRLEVMNFGVGGYGTDQALLRLRREGLGLDADVLCLGLLVENIGRNVNRYRPLWYPRSTSTGAKPRFLLVNDELALVPLPFRDRRELLDAVEDGSVLQRLALHEHWTNPALGPLRYSSLARLAAGYFSYRARDPRRLWSEMHAEPAQVTLAILRAFSREALASGARSALVLVFPRSEDLQGVLDSGEKYWSPLLLTLEREGIACLDLAEPLAERVRQRGGSAGAESLYVKGHLSGRANAVVAEALHQWLRQALRRPQH